VLNETITLEFACGLVAENKGIKLNWVAYALVAHEKCMALQVARDVAKEKKGTLPPILEQVYVLNVGGKSLSLTISSFISRTTKPVATIGVKGKQLPS
jgi:hypothetical protein